MYKMNRTMIFLLLVFAQLTIGVYVVPSDDALHCMPVRRDVKTIRVGTWVTMRHGYYVITILGRSSMIPINWCQSTYGKDCSAVPVSHVDAPRFSTLPTFIGYICTCPNGFTAPFAPEVLYSNNCTIESCQSSECAPTGIDTRCDITHNAVECSLLTQISATPDLVFTLAIEGTCPSIILLNGEAVGGTPLIITTPDACFMSFTTSQQVSTITITGTDVDVAVSTGPCLHCICERPVSDPLCNMNIDLETVPCPDLETAAYIAIPTQKATISSKKYITSRQLAQVRFSLPVPEVADGELMYLIHSPSVITGTGPECMVLGDSSRLSLGSFATGPMIAYYAETVIVGAISVNITGYFMVPKGFDVTGYKFVISQRCANLDSPATSTIATTCPASYAYVSCQTAECVTILDGPRISWNTILVERAPGFLQVCIEGPVAELYYAEVRISNITCAANQAIIVTPLQLREPSHASPIGEGCLECSSCDTTRGSDITIIRNIPTFNGLCLISDICKYMMWSADHPVAVKRPYSSTGTPPSDYFGMSCVYHSDVVKLTWSAVTSTLGQSYVMPAGVMCSDLSELSSFLYPINAKNTTVVKSHGWTLFDYSLDEAYPIVVVLDIPIQIVVLIAGGFAYTPTVRPSSLFHILNGRSDRVVFRVPTPDNDDITVTLKACGCTVCPSMCTAPTDGMLGRINSSGNVSVLYAAAPSDSVSVIPVHSSMSCSGESSPVGLTPMYIKNLVTLLSSEYSETIPGVVTWSQFSETMTPQRRLMLSLVAQQGGVVPASYTAVTTIAVQPGSYLPAPIGLFFNDNETDQFVLLPSNICNRQRNLVRQGCIRVIYKSTGGDVFQYGDPNLPIFGPFRKGQFPYDVQVREGLVDRQLMLSAIVGAINGSCATGIVVFDSYCKSGIACFIAAYSCISVNLKPAGSSRDFGLQPNDPNVHRFAAATIRITAPLDMPPPLCDVVSDPRKIIVSSNTTIDISSIALMLGCTGHQISMSTPNEAPITGLGSSVGCQDQYDIGARRCTTAQTCPLPSRPISGMTEYLQGMSGIDMEEIVATLSVSGTVGLNATIMPLYAYADALCESYLLRHIPREIGSVPRFSVNTASNPLYSVGNISSIYMRYGSCSSADECVRAYSCNPSSNDWNGPDHTEMCGSWSLMFKPGKNSDVHWMSFGTTAIDYDYGIILAALAYNITGDTANLQPMCIGGDTCDAMGMNVFSGVNCHYPAIDFIHDNLGVCGDRYVFGEVDATFSDQTLSSMSLCGGPPTSPPPVAGCYGLEGQSARYPCQFVPGHMPRTESLPGSREIFGAYTNIKYPYLSIMAITTLAFLETSSRFQSLASSVGWPGPPGTPRENWDLAILDSTMKCAGLTSLVPEQYEFYIIDGDSQYKYGGGPWNVFCHLVRMHSVFACQVGRTVNRNHCIPIRGTQFLPQIYIYCWQIEEIDAPIEFFSQSFILGIPDPSRASGVQCNRINGFTPFMPTSKISDLSNLALLYLWSTWEDTSDYNDVATTIIDRIGVYTAAKIHAFDEGQIAMEEITMPDAPSVLKCSITAGENQLISASDNIGVYC